MRTIDLDSDLALKRFAHASSSEKPRFDWKEALSENSLKAPSLEFKLTSGEAEAQDTASIAQTVGDALANLLLSRGEEDIFNANNKAFVAKIADAVVKKIDEQLAATPGKQFSKGELHLMIERILIEQHAYDVAKSLVMQRAAQANTPSNKELANLRLIRRNGQVVPWNANKIEIAVRKAFLALHANSEPAIDVAAEVDKQIRTLDQAFIHIEDVQDIVQESLMRLGHYKVAENYILYRAKRAQQREREELEAPEQDQAEAQQESMILIKAENGQTFFWDGSELGKRIEFASIGLELCLSKEEIEKELRRSVFSEMNQADLKKTIILNAKTLIELDADFAKFAGRILLTYIYEETLGWDINRDGIEMLKVFHQKKFERYIERAVHIERLSPDLLNYDLEKLSQAIDYTADLDFDYLGVQTLYDRYLIIDKTERKQRRLECPQFFWLRVAMGLFKEDSGNREEWVLRLYNLYKSRRFCSSTPTLFNSGTKHSQLSSCYLYKVDDSIESIMYRGIAENAFLSKWAGGIGGSWTSVRGTGSYIQGTNGESQGVIPFLKMHNDQLVAVNQGGKRRGSGVAYLETWHNDILDFLELRRNTGDDRRRTHDMNTANWIPDLFMKRMESRGDWTLFHASEVSDLHETYGSAFEEKYIAYEKLAQEGKIFGKTIPAIDLWKKMLSMLFETGHPWITFKDPCNVRSPQDHVGVIHSSNLCTEITLNTNHEETAVCNLGSVVLDSHIKEDGSLDHEMLRETVAIAMRALDNVIDINFYPTKAAETSNKRHRPVGMGVMGLQNALYKKGIAFASEEAVEFNDEFMEAIAYYAYEASSELAKERGTYSTYKGSKWDRGLLPQDTIALLEKERGQETGISAEGKMDWKPLREKIAKHGMRNSNCLAIAPTATISNIVGTMPCIEPAYKNLYVKSNLSGDFIVLNQALVRDLKERNLWTKEIRDELKYFDGELADIDAIPADLKERYKTAFAIDYNYLLEAAARRQKWIDQAQSVNLFLATPDLKTLSHMYRAAWRMGLKTTYYLRTLGASNIQKATVGLRQEKKNNPEAEEQAKAQEPAAEPAKKIFTAAEKQACSLEAMLNGGECEACQ